MSDHLLTANAIAQIKQNYPPGTRIQLIHMEDNWAVPSGTRGTVECVDDQGHYG